MKFFYRLSLIIVVLLVGTTALSTTVAAQTPVQETASATQIVIQSGNFVATGEPTSGVAQMVQENGRYYLDLSEDFKTKSGPKLVVVLTNFFEPPKRLVPGTYIKLGKLQKIKGTQRYEIPSTVDPNTFHSVAIWCEPFNITFGHAMLNVVPRRSAPR
jgi:Electron transfer DM13